MSLETELQISINRTIFKVIETFSLEEQVGQHALFKATVRGNAVEQHLEGDTLLERSQAFLGERFVFEINDVGGVGRTMIAFEGKVTQVTGKKGDDYGGLGDLIEFTGMSNSILLDDGPHMDSYLDHSLSDIVRKATQRYYNPEAHPVIQPEQDSTLAYSVQHHQSTFGYLQYLAATQGEYLLYSRNKLYFGKPDLGDPITLRYGVDLKDFSLGLGTVPLQFNYFSNDYSSESVVKASSKTAQTNAQGYTAKAAAASQKLFPTADHQQVYYGFESNRLQQQLDSAVTLQKKLTEQRQVSLVGESSNTGVTLGKSIKIKSKAGSFGSYRVTQVTHNYRRGGAYTNSFVAVPLEIDIYPLTDIGAMHSSHPQVAVVKDTNDPQGMSRIQVQFAWQKPLSKTTPWIRVSTPYAGGNRGFHFIPEVGDEVLIGFENGDVERPYMQAALYTGVNKHSSWQSAKNDFKGIATKGGHVIELNDTNGKELITIKDKNSNTITIDTASNSIEVSALENLTLNAKTIELNAQEEVKINAGTNMVTRVTEAASLTAKSGSQVMEEDLTVVAKEILNNAEKVRIESSKENMELVSSKQVDVQANDKIKLF